MPLKSERLSEPQVGDRVRVTFEGEVKKVFPQSGSVQVVRDSFTIFEPSEIEVLEPPVEVFKPGDTVRSRMTGALYSLGKDGWFCHTFAMWFPGTTEAFNSQRHERVEIP